jgi:small GTP-binding protein
MQEDMEKKVVMLGDSGVGKTSIILSALDQYCDDEMQSTVGVNIAKLLIKNPSNEEVKLNVWDTAGQERFQSIVPQYIRNAVVIIIVAAIDNQESMTNLLNWKKQQLKIG